ncbi:MAG: hypothetical protein AVDCRST_MAG69-1080, partial [uncultured Solirubrobacteraceae bacterium]
GPARRRARLRAGGVRRPQRDRLQVVRVVGRRTVRRRDEPARPHRQPVLHRDAPRDTALRPSDRVLRPAVRARAPRGDHRSAAVGPSGARLPGAE